MKLKNIFLINSIVLVISGSSAILFPSKVLLLYGVEPGASVFLMAQYSGLGSLAIGLLTWLFRNVKDVPAQKAVVISLIITFLIGIIISILGTISGVMKVGWPVVVIYLLFCSTYAYFWIFKMK